MLESFAESGEILHSEAPQTIAKLAHIARETTIYDTSIYLQL